MYTCVREVVKHTKNITPPGIAIVTPCSKTLTFSLKNLYRKKGKRKNRKIGIIGF